MRELKDEFERLRRDYAAERYRGDLAELLPAAPAQPARRVRWAAVAAIAAALLLSVALWRPINEQPEAPQEQNIAQNPAESTRPTTLAAPKPSAPAGRPRKFRLTLSRLRANSNSLAIIDLPKRRVAPGQLAGGPRQTIPTLTATRSALRSMRTMPAPTRQQTASTPTASTPTAIQTPVSRRPLPERTFTPRLDRLSIGISLSERRSINGV